MKLETRIKLKNILTDYCCYIFLLIIPSFMSLMAIISTLVFFVANEETGITLFLITTILAYIYVLFWIIVGVISIIESIIANKKKKGGGEIICQTF